MKFLVILSFISLSLAAAPLEVDVFAHDKYCQYDSETNSIFLWNEEDGSWEETPTSHFSTVDAKSQKLLGQTEKVVFPGGASDSLYFGDFEYLNDYVVSLFLKFDFNKQARSFKQVITMNPSNYFLVYMLQCNAVLVGNSSTEQISNAKFFID